MMMASKRPTLKLSVIIVSYNRFAFLRQAVESVQRSRLPFACEVIVVDNGSVGAKTEFSDPFYRNVRIIQNTENVGFGRANNQGAREAGGQFLLFLNNDARLEGGALLLLVEKMAADPHIGALGPLLLNEDGSFQLSFGKRISLYSEFYQKYLAPRLQRRRIGSPPRRDVVRRVGWVSGACLMTRKEFFPDQRIFDEQLFLYFEDHELCLRLAKMGKKTIFWSGPAVRHLGGASGSETMSQVMIEYRRSQLYLYRQHASRLNFFLLKLYLRQKLAHKIRRLTGKKDDQSQAQELIYRRILALIR